MYLLIQLKVARLVKKLAIIDKYQHMHLTFNSILV